MTTRLIRKKRIRAKISGTAKRPRIAVFKSNMHLYLQAIDDQKRAVLASASDLKDQDPVGSLAKKLIEQKIKTVKFDRSGYQYHGKVKAIAESLRKSGLEF